MRRSIDHGRTWSKVSFVAGNKRHFVGNPYPIALSGGRIAVVFVMRGKRFSALGSGNGIVFSSDDGLTWSQTKDISQQFGKARGGLPGPGAGIQLQENGRMLVVSHHGPYVDDYVTYSDDGGETWNTTSQSFPKMDEATLADLGGGSLLLNMRHKAERTKGRGIARSHDGGLTWSTTTYDATLIGPVCQVSLAYFNGSVYFSNPASTVKRSHLTVRQSKDGGYTWPAKLLIQKGKSAGYSSIVQGPVMDDNHGGILYESTTPGAIDFALFPLNLDEKRSSYIV